MAEADQLLASPIAERVVPEGAEVEDIYGMAQPVVIEDPILEYTAVREGVGLLDFSPLLKVDVEGPSARDVINRLHSVSAIQDCVMSGRTNCAPIHSSPERAG